MGFSFSSVRAAHRLREISEKHLPGHVLATVEWYCSKTTGNKIQLRKDFNNFHVQKGRNPIPALFGLEDHVELMRDAGIIVDS